MADEQTDSEQTDGDGERYGVRPPRWKLMIVKWLGVFPPLLGLAYAVQWANRTYDLGLPLWARLLVETMILVPLLNLAITPALDSLFEDWLYPDGAPKAPRADG